MGTLLIIIDQFIGQGEGMVVRHYGKKYGDGGMFFNSFICLFASIFFLITDKGGLCFPKELWLYGIISCFLFATGFYTMYVALATGSYIGTKMFGGFSGIIPIAYGILFLKETATVTTYIATALIFLSVFLRVYQKPGSMKDENASLKWYIYLLLSAISNGFISVVSRMQQIRFDHAYDNEFMPPEYKDNEKAVGHGGMDYALLDHFFKALLNGEPAPISLKEGLAMTLPGIYAEESAKRGGEVLRMRYPWDADWTTEIK